MRQRRERLDVAMVARGLAPTRAKAAALVMAGEVEVGGQRAQKAGQMVDESAEVRLVGKQSPFVSRGGLKLEFALAHFGLDVAGKVCADIGASTGGFTDCLLSRGAAKVYAVDVGRGQLHRRIATDSRVVRCEGVNARYLTSAHVPELVEVMTVDCSFISLRLVLPAVLKRLAPGGTLVALVKPQFEVGRGQVGKGGVVRDAIVRAEAIEAIVNFTKGELHQSSVRVIDSPIIGPAGNIEALLAGESRDIVTGRSA